MSRSPRFQVFSPTLATPLTPPIAITDGSTQARGVTVVWNKDRYVIAWFDTTADTKAIYATAVDEGGVVLVPATAITAPGSFRSRYPSLRPLGDRLLVVYADDRDQNDGFELYARLIGSNLLPLGAEQRVTTGLKDSVYPIVSRGPNGDVGILFRDDRALAEDVFFTRLGCVP